MKRIAVLLAFPIMLACEENVSKEHASSEQDDGKQKTDAKSLSVSALIRKDTPTSVVIHIPMDPVFGSSRIYLTHPFEKILNRALPRDQITSDETRVVFECKDGYEPTIKLGTLREIAKYGYLAFANDDGKWTGKEEQRLSPYYLVWKDVPQTKDAPWPYGLTGLRFEDPDSLASLRPPDEDAANRGFELFEKHCLKCHALNGFGGDVGPELNMPKNIMTYWRRADVIAFAQDPASYRANSKMYAVDGVSEGDLNLIVDYLEYLGTRSRSMGTANK